MTTSGFDDTSRQPPAGGVAGASRADLSRHRMDDRLWQELWERNLSHVERHHVAVAVWRRGEPGDVLASLVGWELAHRWRARARNLAVVYLAWAVFWGALWWAGARTPGGVVAMPMVMCGLGLAAIGACVAVRARLRPIVDGRTPFSPVVAPWGPPDR